MLGVGYMLGAMAFMLFLFVLLLWLLLVVEV